MLSVHIASQVCAWTRCETMKRWFCFSLELILFSCHTMKNNEWYAWPFLMARIQPAVCKKKTQNTSWRCFSPSSQKSCLHFRVAWKPLLEMEYSSSWAQNSLHSNIPLHSIFFALPWIHFYRSYSSDSFKSSWVPSSFAHMDLGVFQADPLKLQYRDKEYYASVNLNLLPCSGLQSELWMGHTGTFTDLP